MSRKIKKYDILILTTKENKKEKIGKCKMGEYLVLSIKPEGIKLFAIRPMNIVEYSLKEFAKKFEVRFYG